MLGRSLLRHVLLPAAERLTPTRFWSYYAESVRFDRGQKAEREALADRRLSHVLTRALGSPFHRQRLERAGLDAGPVDPRDARALLAKLPPAAKAEFRRHFPAGVAAGPRSDDWRYVSTSGTTADGLTVVADFRKRDHNRSSEPRLLRLLLDRDVAVRTVEIPPNACNVVCGLAEDGPPTLLGYLWHALRRGTLFSREARAEVRGRVERRVVLRKLTLPPIEPAPPAALVEALDGPLDRLARARPALLRGLPVYLLWLADRWSQRGRPGVGLRAVSSYGGLASGRMAARIGDGFGAPFADAYGTSELGPVAASCGRGPGMHVFEDQFIVEAHRGGGPAGPGRVGRLVVTDLINAAMPLIRYDVGDVGRLHTDPCPCGRTTARLEVLGRVQEVLESPAGVLTAADVADAFFADPAVANFRLEETRPGCFEAAVVAGPSGGAPDLEACRGRFAALHGGVRQVRARLVPFVRPEPSGKYRFVLPARPDGDPL
jgi:phenylacetate-CoA ligase